MVICNKNIKFVNFAEYECTLEFLEGGQLYWEGTFKLELTDNFS